MKLFHVTLVLTLMLSNTWALGQSRPDRSSSNPNSNAGSRSTPRVGQSVKDESYRIETIQQLLSQLNSHETVAGREESKSYRGLFDAFLDLTAPPMDVNDSFNQKTIHAKMDRWSAVAGWAESNNHMVQALLDARSRLRVLVHKLTAAQFLGDRGVHGVFASTRETSCQVRLQVDHRPQAGGMVFPLVLML